MSFGSNANPASLGGINIQDKVFFGGNCSISGDNNIHEAEFLGDGLISGNNTFDGGAGSDRLYGGFGDDYLDGGAGDGVADYLEGDVGADRFEADWIWTGTNWVNRDKPFDFNPFAQGDQVVNYY